MTENFKNAVPGRERETHLLKLEKIFSCFLDSTYTSINDNIIRNTVNPASGTPEHSSKQRYPSHLSMVWLNIFFHNAAYALKQHQLSSALEALIQARYPSNLPILWPNIFFYKAALALKQQQHSN